MKKLFSLFAITAMALTVSATESARPSSSARSAQVAQAVTKSMTPNDVFLVWNADNQQWGMNAYDNAQDPVLFFTLTVDGVADPLPTAMTLSNSESYDNIFADINDDNFTDLIKDAALTIEYDGTEIKTKTIEDTEILYVLAKISGELTGSTGNKMIVEAPTDFIEVQLQGITLPTEGIENIRPSELGAQKILHEGQIYILNGEKINTVTGQTVR